MGLPKRRQSKARGAKRRTHWKLTNPALSKCPHCNQSKQPHRVCPHCGYYGTRAKVESAEGAGKTRKTVKPARRVLLVKEQ
jgi:large subunit ribosomal protein L32